MHFLAFNLEKFTPDRFFYTGTARGARDKYEVWNTHLATYQKARKRLSRHMKTVRIYLWQHKK